MSMNDPSRTRGYTVGGGETSSRKSHGYDLSAIIDPSTPEADPQIVEVEFPADGWITELVLGWPADTQQAAGVQLRRSTDELLFPRNDSSEYFAAENFTTSFPIKVQIEAGDRIQARYVNNDWMYEHMVNCLVMIEEAEGGF